MLGGICGATEQGEPVLAFREITNGESSRSCLVIGFSFAVSGAIWAQIPRDSEQKHYSLHYFDLNSKIERGLARDPDVWTRGSGFNGGGS